MIAFVCAWCLCLGTSQAANPAILGQVGGPVSALATQGNLVYVGVGMRLIVLDASQPEALREIGATPPFPHFVEGLAASGGYVYVAAGGAGLRVVDIATPSKPVEVAAFDTPGYAEGVVVSGNFVYLADGPYGLRIFDVSNPRAPIELAAVFPYNYAFEAAVSGRYIYIAAAGAGLLIADISDPRHPREVASVDTPGYAYGVAIQQDTVYVADGWQGVQVFQVSDPAHPVLAGGIKTPGWAFGVTATRDYLYVADGFKGLRILDASNPRAPRELGTYEVPGGHVGQIVLAGHVALVADRNRGLEAISLADPARPKLLGRYRQFPYADAVALGDKYAYIAAGSYGVYILDVSDPLRPRQVGFYETESYATSVVIAGDYLYVATTTPPGTRRGLHVVNVRDRARPVRTGYLQDRGGAYRDLAVADGIAYLANEEGLQLVDASDPARLRELAFIPIWEWPSGDVRTAAVGVAVSGAFAYVAAERGGLKIVDVSERKSPRLVGACTWDNASAQDVAIRGGLAYVADTDKITVCDVSNPARPVAVGSVPLPGGFAEGIALDDRALYTASGGAGVWVFDPSDPLRPRLRGLLHTPGYSLEVRSGANLVHVADFNAGLLILDGSAASRAGFPSTAARDDTPRSSQKACALRTRAVPDQIVPLPNPWEPATGAGLTPTAVRFQGSPLSTCTVTSTADAGAGTFRYCLENIGAGGLITFDPAVFPPGRPATIWLSSPLPELRAGRVTIDASQAGVIVDGSRTPPGSSGLLIRSNGNTVKGLQIIRFPGVGIDLSRAGKNTIGGDPSRGSAPTGEGNLVSNNGVNGINLYGPECEGNRIVGNRIGTDAAGHRASGNTWHGIFIGEGAVNNEIRGNLISGNGADGIALNGATVQGNVIAGNVIGTDASGLSAVPNRGNGIFVGGPGNIIGGPSISDRNVISGNQNHGIGFIGEYAEGNRVIGNFIGVDRSGTALLSNGDHGVALEMGAHNNLVRGNVIATSGRDAVIANDWGSSYNWIAGNFLNTDASGNKQLAAPFAGVRLGMGAAFNLVGGPEPGDRNVIAGVVTTGRHLGAGNLILGNYIGLDASGRVGIASEGPGVQLSDGAQRVFVGGTTVGERNVISGGSQSGGIVMGPFVDDCFIAGNYVGTDAAGASSVGNRSDGLRIQYGERNIVQNNLLAYNNGAGIKVQGGSSNALRRNAIHSNRGPGIVLMEGGNRGLAAPLIAAVTEKDIWGWGCPACEIEIFSDEQDEGRLPEAVVRADTAGLFRYEKGGPWLGPRITATVTDGEGNTSEFSTPRLILPTAGPIFNLSAASYKGDPFAPDSLVTVFGSGLARTSEAAPGLPLPTALAGTTVSVTDSSGAQRLAPLYFVSPSQINYQVPAGTSLGMAIVQIRTADGLTYSTSFQVAPVSPGLFSQAGTGSGPAAATLVRLRADGSQSHESVEGPIDLGGEEDRVYLSLYGTGIRHRSSLDAVHVRIGEYELRVEYAGPQGQYPGLDQVNVLLPSELRGKGQVLVCLVVGSKQSNCVQIVMR
jgi:uncharacterized protein (TIGR03437 family)